MSYHGPQIKSRFVPQYDAGALCMDAQAITDAATYNGAAYYDLGSAYNGGVPQLGMWFLPSSDLAGGTSLQFILLLDADGSAGSDVLALSTPAIVLASYEPVCIPIPQNCGYRYAGARVISVGAHTAGTVTAWVGPIN